MKHLPQPSGGGCDEGQENPSTLRCSSAHLMGMPVVGVIRWAPAESKHTQKSQGDISPRTARMPDGLLDVRLRTSCPIANSQYSGKCLSSAWIISTQDVVARSLG